MLCSGDIRAGLEIWSGDCRTNIVCVTQRQYSRCRRGYMVAIFAPILYGVLRSGDTRAGVGLCGGDIRADAVQCANQWRHSR